MEEIIRKVLEKEQVECKICNQKFINQKALRMHNYQKHKSSEVTSMTKEEILNDYEDVDKPELIDAGLFTIFENKLKLLSGSDEIIIKFSKNSNFLKNLNKINKLINLKPLLLEMIEEINEIENIKPELEVLIKIVNGNK